MKNKSFTLIELMLILIITSILLTVALDNHPNTENVEIPLIQVPTKGSVPFYIDDDRHSRETVTLQRHLNGSVWACTENGKCYEVR